MLSPFLRTRDHHPHRRPGRRLLAFTHSPSSSDARIPQSIRSCARHARRTVLPMEVESSVPRLSHASGDGSSSTSRQPAGWPTITSHPANKPSGLKRKMVDDGLGLKRCELSSYMVIGSRTFFKTKSSFPLFLPFPARRISAPGRRHQSTYILSYQLSF